MVDDNPDKYEHFTESDGNLSVNFIKNIKHDYSFTLKDDPRFQTAEPNRGLTSKPFYIDATKVTKYKSIFLYTTNFVILSLIFLFI